MQILPLHLVCYTYSKFCPISCQRLVMNEIKWRMQFTISTSSILWTKLFSSVNELLTVIGELLTVIG